MGLMPHIPKWEDLFQELMDELCLLRIQVAQLNITLKDLVEGDVLKMNRE